MEGGRDIYRELHPVFFISKFLGLAPYTYDFQLSRGFGVVTLTMTLVTIATTGVVMTAPTLGQTTFSLILVRGQALLLGITTVTSLAKSLLNASILSDLARDFVRVDADLKSIGVFVRHSNRYGLFSILTRIVMVVPVLVLDLYNSQPFNPYKLTSEYINIASQLVTFTIEAQFLVLANSIRTRLLSMTRNLTALASKPYAYKPKKLLGLSSCHSTLVEMVGVINALFTIQMLLIMFTIFLLATGHLYNLIDAITQTTNREYHPLMATTLKVCLRSYEIWTVTTMCVDTQENIKEFNNMLYQVLIEDESGLAENKKLQLHVSMKKEVEFTAYNFFSIDYTLVHSMISAATTYLVILIQFSSLSTSSDTTPSP